MKQENKIKIFQENSVFIDNIKGYTKTVTTIPAYTPKKFDQAVKIYMDSLTSPTVIRKYTYSFEAKRWTWASLN